MISNFPDRPTMPEDLNYQVTRREWEILNESEFTCACCGFVSKSSPEVVSGYMEVIIFKDRPTVFCALCSSALRLGRTVNGTINHGLILHAPDITQGQLSNAARILNTAIIEELPYQHGANAVQAKFQRMQASKKDYLFMVDEGSTQQTVNALKSVRRNFEAEASKIFKHLRYFPSRATYRHVFQYWYRTNPDYFAKPV
ncbi:hypothetical protein [Salinimonas chungwhensis]|uniref:hypothetical protein n=1 Tax=Salinimonas chungwhensis TaxID=265425 RepID=UPI001E3CC2BE|nr:hypothetical protein [Salinimonas chungwhensis]